MSEPSRDPAAHARALRDALWGDADALSQRLTDPDAAARARVFANNRAAALAEAVSRSYPAVAALVGEAFMRAAAVEFARIHPPRSPVLATYGEAFPAFLDRFEPVARLAYLSDVARLDRAWTETWFAADEAGLEPDALTGLDEAAIAQLRPGLIPAASIIRLAWPVVDLWAALRAGRAPDAGRLVRRDGAALVWRGPSGPVHRALSPNEARAVEAIAAGAPLAEAFAATTPDAASALFAALLSAGVLRAPGAHAVSTSPHPASGARP
mgnify:CR=1 FL=1